MKRVCIGLALLISFLMSGCANFALIGSFAAEGNQVSVLVKSDFDSMRASCHGLLKRQELLNKALQSSTGSSKEFCDGIDKGLPALASVTFALVDGYHEALGKIANGDSWTLTKEIEGVGGALKGLKDKDGVLIKGAQLDRFTGAATVIVDALLSGARQRATRQLLDQDLPWKDVLEPLRIWYGVEGPPELRNAHALSCAVLSDSWSQVAARASVFVTCKIDKRCEPVRGQELMMESEAAATQLKNCLPVPPQPVSARAAAAVAAIDAWLAANDQLRKSAFKPDARTLLDALSNLKDQREKLIKALD